MVSKKTKRKKSKLLHDPKAPQFAGFKDNKENTICVNDMMFFKIRREMDATGMKDISVDEEGALKVMEEIVNQNVGICYRILVYPGMDMDLTPLQNLILKFLKKHKHLHVFRRLAVKHLSLIIKRKHATLLECQVPRKSVFQILRFVISKIVPLKLLGSTRNWRKFFKDLKRLLWGCRNQKLGLSSLINGMKVLDVPWLHLVPSNSLRLNLLACTVRWLLRWVQNVVGTFWYVTDSMPKQGLIFIFQRDWQSFSERALNHLIHAKTIKRASSSFDKQRVVSEGGFRFMPKPNGTLRPISLMRLDMPEPGDQVQLLQETKTLLWQLAHLTGSVHTPMGQSIAVTLHRSLHQILSHYTTVPQYYFVRADISDAYGSIKHSKLLSILQSLKEDILPADGELELLHLLQPKKMRGPDVYKKTTVFHKGKIVFSIPPGWIDSGKREKRKILPMLTFMSKMIHRLGIRVGHRLFRYLHGIPQGMVLSPVLCELYYSWLDKVHLQNFHSDKELLIRYCDDYLYLTPNRDRAKMFLQTLQDGFPDFSCQINPSKTLTNIDDSTNLMVQFVGFNIRLDNFNVEGNFDSFKGTNIAHTMSFSQTAKMGRVIEKRMDIVMKLNPILIDLNLNSRHTVLLNVFQAALLSAFRLHGLVRTSFPAQTVNQKFVLRCVCRAVFRISNLATRTLKKICPNQRHRVDRMELIWLGLTAFEYRTSRAGAYYPKLVRIIRRRRQKLEKQLPEVKLRVLKKITYPIPAVFTTMK